MADTANRTKGKLRAIKRAFMPSQSATITFQGKANGSLCFPQHNFLYFKPEKYFTNGDIYDIIFKLTEMVGVIF